MYYVIYTSAGMEEKTENYIRTMIPADLYIKCFHPSRCIKKKFGGVWKDCYDALVPGYIFLQCNNIDAFYKEVRKNPKYLNILGRSFENQSLGFYELNNEEVIWLKKLVGTPEDEDIEENATAGVSSVEFGENDEVIVLSGPLKDLVGHIKRINRHKRIAEVEMESFMGRKTVMYLGIDWVMKTQPKEEISTEKNE
ncbi:MAG: KOW motif-containing protein [Lachnospiraceae bacterium]|nr:KOW motif-containing protein [Lachnospiraceae bacterium]